MKHNWEYKRLGEVAPSMPYKGYINPINGKYWCLNLDKIEVNSGKVLDYDFVEETELDGSVHKFTVGNVLFSKLRPNLNKVIVPEQNGYCTTELVPLRPLNILNRYFLAYYLRNPKFVDFLIGKTGGAKMPRVKMDIFWNTAIPVPPMEVQEQIVAELDKINEVICDCRKLLYNLDALAQSLFYDTFGDPVTNPKGWPVKKLASISQLINGRAYKQEELLDKGKYRVIRVGNFFTNSDYYYSDLELPSDKYLENGDLLFAWSASFGAFIWSGEKVIYHYHIWKIIYDDNILNKQFYKFLLNEMTSSFMKDLHGIGMMHLTKTGMENYLLPIPPLALQERFAAQVEAIEEQKKAVEATIAELQTLLDSRMDYWFN